MLCLELVETAPRMMRSTPRGKGMCWLAYITYFLSHFQGWTLGNSLTLFFISYLHFWQRKDHGFAALFGIHVALCVDGVFLSVLLSCVCVTLSLFNLLQLNK